MRITSIATSGLAPIAERLQERDYSMFCCSSALSPGFKHSIPCLEACPELKRGYRHMT
jgi:hypothetical protein